MTAEDGLPHPYKHLRQILLPDVPESIAFIVADAIHNMRVALDYLMSELASQAGHARRHPTFPICHSKEAFESNQSRRYLDARAWEFIASLEPFKCGDDLLWWLHSIDRIDKHRRLSVIQHGPPVNHWIKDDEAPGGRAIYLLPTYWLEESSGAPRRSVVELLLEMRERVADVLQKAEMQLFMRPNGNHHAS